MGALCAQRKMLAMRVSVFGQQVAVRAAPSAVVRRARSPRVPAPPPSTSIEETPMGGERESRAGAGAGVEVARARAHASARAHTDLCRALDRCCGTSAPQIISLSRRSKPGCVTVRLLP